MREPTATARDLEAAMPSTCVTVTLLRAAEADSSDHPNGRIEPADVLRRGRVASLPRLRDMSGLAGDMAMPQRKVRDAAAIARRAEAQR